MIFANSLYRKLEKCEFSTNMKLKSKLFVFVSFPIQTIKKSNK